MKTLNPAPRFLVWAVWQSIRHPRRPISYHYCPKCKLRLPPDEEECPVCHVGINNSPQKRQQSPIPWYGSVAVIVLGIVCWCLGHTLPVAGLDEAGRALVYLPLGNLFGMSINA